MTIAADDAGYHNARQGAALADRSGRVRIEVTGPGRGKVLHNLTTNDIKRLEPGAGREAFLTSGQGKTLAFLAVHAEADRLLVRADVGTAAAILEHTAKYGLFDDAAFADVSGPTFEWHLAGPEARRVVEGLGLDAPEIDLHLTTGEVVGHPVRVIAERPTGGPGFTLIGSADAAGPLRAAIEGVRPGIAVLSDDAWETLRIEAGTPAFLRDITAANLPQEVGRDARAISFVKGCYLGQETVARLDALGHVNKILTGLVSDTEEAAPSGSVLMAEGKEVGRVTSSAFSPALGCGVMLGYVKVDRSGPGAVLEADGGPGRLRLTVRGLPIVGA